MLFEEFTAARKPARAKNKTKNYELDCDGTSVIDSMPLDNEPCAPGMTSDIGWRVEDEEEEEEELGEP